MVGRGTILFICTLVFLHTGCIDKRSLNGDAGDPVEEDDGRDGCGQTLPGILEVIADYCTESDPSHCISTGCGECQVCYTDLSAFLPDPLSDVPPPYTCHGDGLCHDLCHDDGDCEAGMECRYTGWFNGYDTLSHSLNMCWPVE